MITPGPIPETQVPAILRRLSEGVCDAAEALLVDILVAPSEPPEKVFQALDTLREEIFALGYAAEMIEGLIAKGYIS